MHEIMLIPRSFDTDLLVRQPLTDPVTTRLQEESFGFKGLPNEI